MTMYENLDRQAARDRDEERRIFPGVPDPQDMETGEAAQAVAKRAHSPVSNDSEFADFVEEQIGEDAIGDPVPALISAWWREVHGTPLYPGIWLNMLRANRVDPHSARRGDVLRFQYGGTYDRYWHGVILEVGDGARIPCRVAVAQSLRDAEPTELRVVTIEYDRMRGFALNSSWPATSIVRLVP